jgi:hypothetical protein
MRLETGVISGWQIKKNKDGSQPVRLLQVVISDPQDVQTVEWISQAGEDSNPPKKSSALILPVGYDFFDDLFSDPFSFLRGEVAPSGDKFAVAS